MQDLQLIGVHEDGEHLLLTGPDGERFRMPVDDALRAAVRRDRPHLGQQQIDLDGGLRPRDVQALIRAGSTAEEVARRAGWPVEKVHRYEGPILAEREHVAGLAQQARLRSRTGPSSSTGAPTLWARVSERLKARDVQVTDANWDSWRTEGGPWTVVLTFAAGGRQRQASWSFDLADRTVSAVDDEARWLSEEVQEAKGPIPAPKLRSASASDAAVYDVEAEGGLRPLSGEEAQEDPLDLMTAMRKRSTARGRRKPGPRSASPAVPKAADSGSDPDQQVRERAAPAANAGDDPEPMSPPAEHAPALIDLEYEEAAPSEATPGESVSEVAHASRETMEKPVSQSQSKPRAKRQGEAARKTGRPSVPAWDEIMFGSRPGIDRSSS